MGEELLRIMDILKMQGINDDLKRIMMDLEVGSRKMGFWIKLYLTITTNITCSS
jgi:hypothetical protein